MFFRFLENTAFIVPVVFILFWLALIVVHVAFANAVYRHSVASRDAGNVQVFVAPWLWALATLVTGVIGATAYWLLHCSALGLTATPVLLAESAIDQAPSEPPA